MSLHTLTKQLAPPSLDELQQAFPGYRFLELVGLGSRGSVFRAEDRRHFDREVAVKSSRFSESDVESNERFTFECESLAKLRHPNIPAYYDDDRNDDLHIIVMDWMPDGTLQQLLAKRNGKRLRLAKIVDLMDQACQALTFAHQENRIHRDVKPANMLLKGNHLRLTDFGLARSDAHSPGVTQMGASLGTPGYMAPEQEKSGPIPIDHRADIYSLGVVLYELLTMSEPKGITDLPSKHGCPKADFTP